MPPQLLGSLVGVGVEVGVEVIDAAGWVGEREGVVALIVIVEELVSKGREREVAESTIFTSAGGKVREAVAEAEVREEKVRRISSKVVAEGGAPET